jgi:long-chain fatty acid transport protein
MKSLPVERGRELKGLAGKAALLSFAAATAAFGQGYKIPEQSLNATALSGAYVSHSNAADAAYYNPANMAFMGEEKHFELNLMYIHLTPVKYEGTFMGLPADNESKREHFVLPQLYLVSEPLGNARIGLSINEPAGLAKRWSKPPQSYAAKTFDLKVIEVNPSVSYEILENLAVAAGVRFVYSEGIVQTDPMGPVDPTNPESYGLDMKGDSWDLGYNLALSYKPFESWGMALTYRSKVDMTMEGAQKFNPGLEPAPGMTISAVSGSVTLPLPAVLTVATDYTIAESTTLEFVYERTFWSEYEKLTIEVGGSPVVDAEKEWEDKNTFRLGVTQKIGENWTGMLGLAYDETPMPDKTLGFELPDSNAYIASIGVRYRISEAADIGIAYLYDYKEDRKITASDNNDNFIVGEFSGSSAHMFSVGLGYRF